MKWSLLLCLNASVCCAGTINLSGSVGSVSSMGTIGTVKTAQTGPAPTSACSAPGTAIAFRTTANDTAGTQVNDVVTKPVGTVDNDVMIADCHLEMNAASLTPPAGWTLIVSTHNETTSPDAYSYLYFKRASGEGASYTWTHASNFSQCAIASYSGVNTTCGPFDTGQSTNVFNAATTWTGTSINTLFTNNMLILTQDNFEANSAGPPTSPAFTERLDTNTISFNEFKQTAIGASGDATGTFGASTNGGVCFVSLID